MSGYTTPSGTHEQQYRNDMQYPSRLYLIVFITLTLIIALSWHSRAVTGGVHHYEYNHVPPSSVLTSASLPGTPRWSTSGPGGCSQPSPDRTSRLPRTQTTPQPRKSGVFWPRRGLAVILILAIRSPGQQRQGLPPRVCRTFTRSGRGTSQRSC